MDARESGKVIEAATKRIRKDIEGRRGRRSKLRPTPLQVKRKWIREILGVAETTRSQPYTAPPWVIPLKVVIVPDKSRAIKQHNADKSFQGLRMYSDGSGRDRDVTAAATNLHWESGQRLGGVGIALTHHGELEGLITAAERLARISMTDTECRGRIYKVYSDSQASLMVVDAIRSTSD